MKTIIERFYHSFSELNAEAMAACYHEEAVFEDPAFGQLNGEQVRNMWRMLCHSQKGKEFKVTFSEIAANEHTGSARWEAFYTFSKTGRKVHNIIQAEFVFQDGKIISHHDHFSLHRWAGQAMGPIGLLLGWTPMFKRKIRANTNHLLRQFESRQQ